MALDVGSGGEGVLFPPVRGIVPDAGAGDGGTTDLPDADRTDRKGELPQVNDGGGGGGAKDLQVAGLALITEGINLAMSELRELGMIGQASVGRGFADLAWSWGTAD